MKKFVFFFFFACLMTISVVYAKNDDVYDVRYNYDLEKRRIQVTHKDEPSTIHFLGDGTLDLTFRGDHGFAGEYYAIKAREVYSEGSSRYFRAHLMVLDSRNEVYMTAVYDDYKATRIQDVYALEDTLIVQLQIPKEENALTSTKTIFYFYKNSELYKEHVIEEALYLSDQDDPLLFAKRTGTGPYIFCFDKDGQKFQASDFAVEETYYQGSLDLVLFDEAILNKETLSKGVHKISYPGYYTLAYQGQSTDFGIDPFIEGFEADKTYDEPLDIHYAYGQLYLNDQLYTSGDIIDEPGHYTFRIAGINDYEITYKFTLENDLETFKESVHTTPVELDFMGEIWLNDEKVERGHVIYQGGDYTLEILGRDDFKQTAHFSLLTDEVTFKDQLLSLEIGIAISILILGGLGLFGLYKKR